jgi:hypothetical protein
VAHSIPPKMTSSAVGLVLLYIKEIVRLHGVPKSILLDRTLSLCIISSKVLWARNLI